MIRVHKHRMYPTKTQEEGLKAQLRTHCDLYNAALQERNDAYKKQKVSIRYRKKGDPTCQQAQLVEIRKENEDVKNLGSAPAQRTLQRAKKAYDNFFRRVRQGTEKAGYPKFKPYRYFRTIEYTPGSNIKIEKFAKRGKTHINNIGSVKTIFHRELPKKARVKSLLVKHDLDGKWYLIITFETPTQGYINGGQTLNEVLGIDLGVKNIAATSEGEIIAAPKFFKKSSEVLAKRQQNLSRKKKRSNRRRKQRRLVAKTHSKITRQRKDFLHKQAKQLVEKTDVIALENLNLKGLSRSFLAKEFSDAACGELVKFIEEKAEMANKTVMKVNPKNTSKMCSRCGALVEKELSDREHKCKCGYKEDRDVNAAINIKNKAIDKLYRPG